MLGMAETVHVFTRLDWVGMIAAARERGGFERKERRLAASWLTCATAGLGVKRLRKGERISRSRDRAVGVEPRDELLRTWGIAFGTAVNDDDFDLALGLLDRIERRAREMV